MRMRYNVANEIGVDKHELNDFSEAKPDSIIRMAVKQFLTSYQVHIEIDSGLSTKHYNVFSHVC